MVLGAFDDILNYLQFLFTMHVLARDHAEPIFYTTTNQTGRYPDG